MIRDAATKPKVPVTNEAVPKPVSQSSRRSGAGARSPQTEPSLAEYTTGSRETTQSTPKGCSPRGKPCRVRSFLRTSCNRRSWLEKARSITCTAVGSRRPAEAPVVMTGMALSRHSAISRHFQAGVHAHSNEQRGLRADGVAANIQAVVEVVDDVDEADGVDVEDRRGVGVKAHARRIAGDADEVAHPRGVRAQQLRLDAQNVAVAAAEVAHRLDAGVLLNQLAGYLGDRKSTRLNSSHL